MVRSFSHLNSVYVINLRRASETSTEEVIHSCSSLDWTRWCTKVWMHPSKDLSRGRGGL
ncbi:MAG: hypothetical protein ACTS6P_00995 [Candidatus Hodgkinia cicadicola]